MHGIPNHQRAAVAGRRPSELEPSVVLDQRSRDRQSAIACLQAAASTGDAAQRERLRRQAAQMVLPRGLVARA